MIESTLVIQVMVFEVNINLEFNRVVSKVSITFVPAGIVSEYFGSYRYVLRRANFMVATWMYSVSGYPKGNLGL